MNELWPDSVMKKLETKPKMEVIVYSTSDQERLAQLISDEIKKGGTITGFSTTEHRGQIVLSAIILTPQEVPA